MKKGFDYSRAREVSIEFNGKTIKGRYVMGHGVLTLDSIYGQISTQLGGLTQEGLARILLRELVSGKKEI